MFLKSNFKIIELISLVKNDWPAVQINVTKRVNVDHTLVPQVQWMRFAADELVGFTFTLVTIRQ